LSHGFQIAIGASALPKRTTALPLPMADILIVGLLAGGTAICVGLLAPVLWTAIADAVRQAPPNYAQCSTVTEDANRLACYDHVRQQGLLHAAKGRRLNSNNIATGTDLSSRR
jgi:hypothetical protein